MAPAASASRNSASEASARFTEAPASSALGKEPVEDLGAGPEYGSRMRRGMGERGAEIFEPVRRAHDVGVDDERHHASGCLGIGVELVELVDRAVAVLARLVMLDQHHR